MVECHGVTKAFGDLTVLDGIDLVVAAGEKVAVIGPSGSGKTTLLRVVMGLERPTQGTVRLDRQVLWDDARPPREKELRRVRAVAGYVFQQFNLFPHMTALRNITEAPIRVRGLERARAEEQALELLERVGLRDKADARPAELSGGQQQRVAIARALALDPKVMLFDEVTSALDPELVGEVLKVIADIALHSNMTMILVTHEMTFARRIADRVVFFDHGRIVEEGPPAKIFTQPDHERTRAFLHAVLNPI